MHDVLMLPNTSTGSDEIEHTFKTSSEAWRFVHQCDDAGIPAGYPSLTAPFTVRTLAGYGARLWVTREWDRVRIQTADMCSVAVYRDGSLSWVYDVPDDDSLVLAFVEAMNEYAIGGCEFMGVESAVEMDAAVEAFYAERSMA